MDRPMERKMGRVITPDRFDDKTVRALQAVAGGCRTMREIGEEIDMSLTAAYDRMNLLKMAGLVTWEPRKAGTIRLTCEWRHV